MGDEVTSLPCNQTSALAGDISMQVGHCLFLLFSNRATVQPLCGKRTGQQLEVGGGKAGQVVHQGTRILSMLFSTILTKLGYTECGPGMTRVGSKCYLIANNLHSHQEVDF